MPHQSSTRGWKALLAAGLFLPVVVAGACLATLLLEQGSSAGALMDVQTPGPVAPLAATAGVLQTSN